MEQLKVSTRSNPNSVAGAMAGVVRTPGAVEVQVVGAGALNQAVKAVAIARENPMVPCGLKVEVRPVSEECPASRRAKQKLFTATA